MPVTKKKETYSEAMARLEKIVSQIDNKGSKRNYSILQR